MVDKPTKPQCFQISSRFESARNET